MAGHQLAHRNERKAQGSFCCCPRAGRRRTTAADQGQGSATSARGRGLAHRRTQDVGREEILSLQPASEDPPAHLSNHHQGALGLRAGSPADERRTWSLPLRGTILARPSSSCAYDDDRLRLPPASPARNSKAGKKESTGRRLSQLCPPYATPSSNSSLDYRRSDARIVENGFATSGGLSKSAKVVLGRVLINGDCRQSPADVRFTPESGQIADISGCPLSAKRRHSHCSKFSYSITSSARVTSEGGRSRPSALAVLRLIVSSILVGNSIGRSPALAPFRIRST